MVCRSTVSRSRNVDLWDTACTRIPRRPPALDCGGKSKILQILEFCFGQALLLLLRLSDQFVIVVQHAQPCAVPLALLFLLRSTAHGGSADAPPMHCRCSADAPPMHCRCAADALPLCPHGLPQDRPKDAIFNSLYQHSVQHHMARKQAQEKALLQKKEEEKELKKQCTFRPTINKRYGGGGGRTRKHREAGCGRPEDGDVWTAKIVKRPPQQPAQSQYANDWAPLTRKRHIPPHPAQPRHHWAPRTRKRHQQEHRPQRPSERSDPTQHAKGRTGDCPGPRKGATTRRNVTQGGGVFGVGTVGQGHFSARRSTCGLGSALGSEALTHVSSGLTGDFQVSRVRGGCWSVVGQMWAVALHDRVVFFGASSEWLWYQ